MSGIVTLTTDGEPLNDGDPFDCFFDYDSGGNNTIDFGFYKPSEFVWLGNSDSDWNNPNNWSAGVVPNVSSNVLIPNGSPNYPIVNQNVSVFTICVALNATLTLLPNVIFTVASIIPDLNCHSCNGYLPDYDNDGVCDAYTTCVLTRTLNTNPENQGTYHAEDWIVSSSKVNANSGGVVNYFAENNYVELQSNFVADGSFDFNAEIVPCQ